MTVLPSYFAGITFRSRQEARWAVFFQTLGIEWRYEPEGYLLAGKDGLCYLPDFYIPVQPKFPKSLWVEVKPDIPLKEDEWLKLHLLAAARNERVTALRSIPWPDDAVIQVDAYGCSSSDALASLDTICIFPAGEDQPYLFCQCPFCFAFGFEFDGRSARVGCGCPQHRDVANGDKTYNAASIALCHAYSAARSHRFEGGSK